MNKKRIIIGAFAALLLGAGLMVWFGQQGLRKGGLYYSGTVEAAVLSNLSFQVGGKVMRVHVTEGQRVEKDQPLAELDGVEFEAARDQAKAALDRAERSREQASAVLEIYRRTLPDDVARAEAGVASARDVLAEAQSNKERYEKLFAREVVSKKEWEAVKLHYDTARSRLA
ncbi:MAG TPA: biotin/lipoyl-binding protein, partial [Syntrophales bacterium]|nr:biotin/lipoyl-binding protein [Syntrophales bacterium]